MSKIHQVFLWGAYLLCGACAMVFVFAVKQDAILADDAGVYHAVAENILQFNQYTLDGVQPYLGREPGYSVFLSLLYRIVGVQNVFWVFLVQIALFTGSVLLLKRELLYWIDRRAAFLCQWLLLLYPSLWVAHVSVLRESLAATLCTLSIVVMLYIYRKKQWWLAALSGVCFGVFVLVAAPFFLLPIFLIPIHIYKKMSWGHIVLMIVFYCLTLSPWVLRNIEIAGAPCIAGCNRADLQWAVRGEQARDLRNLEPLRCLWSEYISRNWEGRSPNCHFNAVMHRMFPNGFTGSDADAALGNTGKELIKQHWVWYLWHSVFEVIDLHLPYVNSWGVIYNSIIAIYTVLISIGCGISLWYWKKIHLVCLGIIVYTTGIYVLSDAIPRYLLPILVCYCILASVGYIFFFYRHER